MVKFFKRTYLFLILFFLYAPIVVLAGVLVQRVPHEQSLGRILSAVVCLSVS
jgi:phosphate starvation-inducible membrane PsiE